MTAVRPSLTSSDRSKAFDRGRSCPTWRALAREAERVRKSAVVVLENAPFHKAGAGGNEREGWKAKGLILG
jgi:hypothetical protein